MPERLLVVRRWASFHALEAFLASTAPALDAQVIQSGARVEVFVGRVCAELYH